MLGKTNSSAKTVTNVHDVEPAALENESFDDERSDNIDAACETDLDEDERTNQ